jgi:hypothetical protein
LSYKFRICLPATGQRRVTINWSHKIEKGKSGGIVSDLLFYSAYSTYSFHSVQTFHRFNPKTKKKEHYHKSIHSIHFPLPLREKIKFLDCAVSVVIYNDISLYLKYQILSLSVVKRRRLFSTERKNVNKSNKGIQQRQWPRHLGVILDSATVILFSNNE